MAQRHGPYTLTASRLRASLTLQQPNGLAWVQSYGYDGGNRLSSVVSPAGAFGYTYASPGPTNVASSLIQTLTYPNGTYLTNSYSLWPLLTNSVLLGNGGATLDANQYTYANWGDPIYKHTRASGAFLNHGYNYGAPSYGILTGVGANDPSGAVGYGYDTVENLTTRTRGYYNFTQTFTPNYLNQYTSVTRNTARVPVTGWVSESNATVTVNGQPASVLTENTILSYQTLADGNNTFTAVATDSYGRSATNTVTVYAPLTQSFTYDGNGNLTSDGLRTFYYDDENHLTNVTVAGAWKSEFAYDGKQRRRIRKEYAWQGGAWALTNEVRYVYDGNLVLQERNYLNLPMVTYTRGRDRSGSFEGAGGIGGLLARTSNPDLFGPNPSSAHAYYSLDAQGNVAALVNSRQAVVARYIYEPYGSFISLSGPLAEANVYRFSSKELHANSGLYYFGLRYYSPQLQRWTSRDPLGERGGVNLYTFCGNDPVNGVDPYGLSGFPNVMPVILDIVAAQARAYAVMQSYSLAHILSPALVKSAQYSAVATYMASASIGNRINGGAWAQAADDQHVTAYQLFYQFVYGTGPNPNTRTFDETSVMGQDMLRAGFVTSAIDDAFSRAVQGDFSKKLISYNLGSDVPWYEYPLDFACNALGNNPALAFQGSLGGDVKASAPVQVNGQSYIPITVTLHDVSNAESATRLPPPLGYNGGPYRALFLEENPFGPNGPFRTITESYNLHILKPISTVP